MLARLQRTGEENLSRAKIRKYAYTHMAVNHPNRNITMQKKKQQQLKNGKKREKKNTHIHIQHKEPDRNANAIQSTAIQCNST